MDKSNEIFLSICITSYNRTKELFRCLNSIESKLGNEIEIIVSEDCSPKKDEIREIVEEYIKKAKFKVIFNSNEINLGYDRNLGKLIELARGKYILFLSDDDSLISDALDKIIDGLKKKSPAMAFSPFYEKTSDTLERKFYSNFNINSGAENAGKYLYSSILFSGLIFEKEKVKDYNANNFVNLMYFQVYLFLNIVNRYGAYYFDIPLVFCMNDGENAFGISESSIKNELLANRKSIFSNLEYHKGLISVIKIFDNENKTNVISQFSKEYSLRMYGGLARARRVGMTELQQYWSLAKKIDLKLTFVAKAYYILLLIFGKRVSDFIVTLPKKILLKVRTC